MHLLVPFASNLSEACQHVLRDLALPRLERLLALLTAVDRDEGEVTAFSPPHERALAAAWGWHGGDGALPFAARAATADAVDTGDLAWGLLTPAHWQLGRDDVVMLDPATLGLVDAESRALFDSLHRQFESEGFRTAWGGADRWYAGHACLDGFATASLDRVIGRNVDGWLRESGPTASADRRATARLLRRLQSEAQLLFHEHAVNDAREASDRLSVNSFWLSGCGRFQPADAAATPEIAAGLRAPLLAGDWVAWAEAWQGLDTGAIEGLLARARAGEPVALTLCGERSAVRYESRPRPLVQRWRDAWQKREPQGVLAAL